MPATAPAATPPPGATAAPPPMYLPSVEAALPPGPAGEAFGRDKAAGAPVPRIRHLFAFRPERTRHLQRFTQAVMRGQSPLTPAQRELIAAVVSAGNACAFCRDSHAATAARLLGDPGRVEQVLADPARAPLTAPERALLAFAAAVNASPGAVRQADVDAVLAAGWSEAAVYDAITVCALFRFYNTWVHANGVGELPPEGYAASGERLATEGYAPLED